MSDTSYGLDPHFERKVLALCVENRGFWGRIGKDLDPGGLNDQSCQKVLEACRAIAASASGAHPGGGAVVIQRFRSWYEAGRLSQPDFRKFRNLVMDLSEDAEDLDADSIADELSPVVQRFVEREVLAVATDTWAKRGDMAPVIAKLQKAKRIGKVDTSLGAKLKTGLVSGIRRRANYSRRPFGIPELDSALRGGQKRGTLAVITGPTGSGKSFFCDHAVAEALTCLEDCAIATLELSEDDHYVRIIANLIYMDYEDILEYPDVGAEAERRMDDLLEDGLLGTLAVKEFTARATTVEDLRAWHAAEQEAIGRKITTVCVDYGTLLSSPNKRARHEEMTEVAEQLRAWAVDDDIFLIVPNQANADGMSKKTKRIENEHSADSKGIPKTADLHITLNPRDEGESMMFYVAKNRHGPTGEEVGPLPLELSHGRIAPIQREGWPY